MHELNSEQLKLDGRNLPSNFIVHAIIDDVEYFITVEQVLRVLPGRRIVAKIRLNNNDYLMKLFINDTKNKYINREVDGYNLLNATAIKTPKLCHSGKLSDGNSNILLYQYITANSLLHLWHRRTEAIATKDGLIQQVISIIAQMHKNQLIQKDIHLGNFLIAGSDIYVIDTADICQLVTKKASTQVLVVNLATFLAQFEQDNDDQLSNWLPYYFNELLSVTNNSSQFKLDTAPSTNQQQTEQAIIEEVAKQRKLRVKRYLKKVFRDSTEFVAKKSFFCNIVYNRCSEQDDFVQLIENIEKFFKQGVFLKQGNTAEVVQVVLDGRVLVIKKYKAHRLKYWLRRCWRKSRAWISWKNACRLKMLGIASVKPIALIEKRFGFITLDSYFITEEISGINALNYYRNKSPSQQELDGFSKLFIQLHKSRLIHGDMKATNFMMVNGSPLLIDLDSMQEYPALLNYRRAYTKEITRFMKNWADNKVLHSIFHQHIVMTLQARKYLGV